MIFALWGSWFLLFIIARLLGGLAMILTVVALAWLPGNRSRRFGWLIYHSGRLMYLIGIGAALLSLTGIYFLSQWWFTLIDFAPVNVAVFGSVGIAAITWLASFTRNRHKFVIKIQDDHDDEA